MLHIVVVKGRYIPVDLRPPMRADVYNEKHTNENRSIEEISVYMTGKTPTRVEDIANSRTVFKVDPNRSRGTRRRKVHLTNDCSHCPDDTDSVRAGTLHQTDRICKYCRGWSPDGSDDEIYEQVRKADSLSDYRRRRELNADSVSEK